MWNLLTYFSRNCKLYKLYNTPKSVEKDVKVLVKGIKSITIECGEDCSCVSPMTNNIISICNRLQCHFHIRPDVTLENALNQSLFSYHSLEKCKLPSEDSGNSNGGTDNPKNGEVSTTPKPQDITEAEATGNRTADSREDSGNSNGGTDNPKNGQVTPTPKRQEMTEAIVTGNGTTDSNEYSGDSNGGTDNQENPYSGSNQPLKINGIGIALVIVALVSLASILIHHLKNQFSLCKTNSNTNLI